MAAELVGTAYISIRAITSGISDDIKDGLDKGSKDAKKDSEKSGKQLGEDMGGGLGEGLGDSLDEEIPGAIKDSSESKDSQKASDEGGRSLGQRIADSFRSHMGPGLNKGLADSLHNAGADNEDDSHDLGDHIGASVTDGFHKNVNVGIPNALENALKPGGRTNAASDEMGKSLWTRIADVFHNDAGDFSSRMGDSIGEALGGIGPAGGTLGLVFLNLLPVIAGVAQIAIALIGAIVAALGFIVTAAAGAGVALAGVGAAFGLSILPILLAFKAETPALEAFMEQFSAFKESWLEVGAAAQEGLLPALSESLTSLQDLIPRFKEFGKEIGFSVGNIAKLATHALTSDKNLDHMGRVMAGSVTIMDHLGRGVVAVFDAIMPILDAAMPAATRLAESVGNALEHFNEFIQKKSETGELTATFDKWYDRLASIGTILGNVFGALWNIFSSGGDAAEGMFTSLEGITQHWQDWTGSMEGKNTLADFFSNAIAISGEVLGIISDIFNMLITPLMGATGSEGLIGILRTFRDEFLPVIGELVGLIADNAAPMLGDLFEQITIFVGIIGDNPELAVGIFGIMGASLWILTAALEGLNAILSTDLGVRLAQIVITMAAFAKVLSMLKVLSPLMGILGSLAGIIWEAVLPALAALVAAIGWPLIVIAALVAAFVLLYLKFKPFRDLIDGLVDSFMALDWEGYAASIMAFVDTIKDAFTGLTFGGIVEAIGNGLSAAAHALGDFARSILDAIPGLIRTAVQFIIRIVQDLPAKIGEMASSAYLAFVGWIADVAPKMAEGLGIVTGTVLRWILWEIPNAIINAIPTVIQAFFSLVEGIINYTMSAGPTILRTFLDIFVALPGFIASALDGFLTFITTVIGSIPTLIVAALSTLAQFLLGVFEGAFPGAMSAIEGFLGKVTSFFSGLPSKVVSALSSIGSAIGGVFSAAWGSVSTAISGLATNIVEFWVNLPDRIVSKLTGLASAISGVFSSAWTTVKSGAQTLFNNVIGFFEGLPGAITRALSGIAGSLASGIGSAFKKAWNSVIDGIGTISYDPPGPFIPKITLGLGFLKLAKGAVINSPTMALVGEAGSEAVIPLRNKSRALQLLQESGLDKLVLSSRKGDTSIRTGAALHIEHATFNDPVTADIVAAKVMAAIRL